MKKIINKIIGFFLNPNSIKSLTAESEDIINVFTSTVDKLGFVNEAIVEEVDKKQRKVVDLNIQITSLEAIKLKNAKIISKVAALIAD